MRERTGFLVSRRVVAGCRATVLALVVILASSTAIAQESAAVVGGRIDAEMFELFGDKLRRA